MNNYNEINEELKINSETKTSTNLNELDDVFFKNCFTETEDGVNAEFNELKAKCLTGTNGTFRIDSMGNITCNSVLTTGPDTSSGSIDFDQIYPVGSIYLTTAYINPNGTFKGRWEPIKDRFLLAAGDLREGGLTGGAEETTLSVDNIPSHSHRIPSLSGSSNYAGEHTHNQQGYWSRSDGNFTDKYCMATNIIDGDPVYSSSLLSSGGHTHTINTDEADTNTVGNGKSISIMPPYLTVYVWQRVE